jgi:hypothetical protein
MRRMVRIKSESKTFISAYPKHPALLIPILLFNATKIRNYWTIDHHDEFPNAIEFEPT